MDDLPRTYVQFLTDLDPLAREAVLPIFRQSAADGKHGVKVWLMKGTEVQASVTDDVAFGDVKVLHE